MTGQATDPYGDELRSARSRIQELREQMDAALARANDLRHKLDVAQARSKELHEKLESERRLRRNLEVRSAYFEGRAMRLAVLEDEYC